MQFTSSILATMLAIGFVQAQTPTCSNVPNPSPPATMHCNVRGVLDPALINITSSNVVASVDACITLSKAYEDSLAFSYNYTSLICNQYGTNLHLMGLKQKKKLDPDTVYFNHNCYVQQCNNAVVSTSTAADGSATTVSSAAPMTTTLATCDKNADRCLSMFNSHPKTASSVCAGVQTQYFPPQGFGGACTQVWDAQVSSVCSCLYGAQLVPTTTFMSNTTAAPTSVPANTTATMTGGPSSITDAPIFGNSTAPIIPPFTTFNATSTSSAADTSITDAPVSTDSSSIVLLPPFTTTSSDNTTISTASATDSPTLVVPVPSPSGAPVFSSQNATTLFTSTTTSSSSSASDVGTISALPVSIDNGTTPMSSPGASGASGTASGGLVRRTADPAAPFAVNQQKRSFRLRRNNN